MKSLILAVFSLVLSAYSLHAEVCHRSSIGLFGAKYTHHMKGHLGSKCWHPSIRTAKPRISNPAKGLYDQFNDWKRKQIISCLLGLPGCDPLVKRYLDRLILDMPSPGPGSPSRNPLFMP